MKHFGKGLTLAALLSVSALSGCYTGESISYMRDSDIIYLYGLWGEPVTVIAWKRGLRWRTTIIPMRPDESVVSYECLYPQEHANYSLKEMKEILKDRPVINDGRQEQVAVYIVDFPLQIENYLLVYYDKDEYREDYLYLYDKLGLEREEIARW